MGNIISLSISNEDKHFLKENKQISPSKLFRDALKLERFRREFLDIYSITDFHDKVLRFQERFLFLGKEIRTREERIESLQDVLAKKELAQRRV